MHTSPVALIIDLKFYFKFLNEISRNIVGIPEGISRITI